MRRLDANDIELLRHVAKEENWPEDDLLRVMLTEVQALKDLLGRVSIVLAECDPVTESPMQRSIRLDVQAAWRRLAGA